MKKVSLATKGGPMEGALRAVLPIFGVRVVEAAAADVLMTCTKEETLEALESSGLPIVQMAMGREFVTHRRVTPVDVLDCTVQLPKVLAD